MLEEVKPKLVKDITSDVSLQIIDLVFAYKTFGLRYDQINRIWRVIINENQIQTIHLVMVKQVM